MGFAKWFDSQDKVIKILLMIPFIGWAIGAVYRVFKFIETKDTATLVGAILDVIFVTGFILSIIDFVTVIMDGKLKVLVPAEDSEEATRSWKPRGTTHAGDPAWKPTAANATGRHHPQLPEGAQCRGTLSDDLLQQRQG